MPRSLGTASARVHRLANRLQLDDRPDVTKMSDKQLCAEALELSLKATGCLVRDFQSYGEFVEAISRIGAVMNRAVNARTGWRLSSDDRRHGKDENKRRTGGTQDVSLPLQLLFFPARERLDSETALMLERNEYCVDSPPVEFVAVPS